MNKIKHVAQLLKSIHEEDKNENSYSYTTSTGFKQIDESVGEFFPGELVIVGGRPAMGKRLLLLIWLSKRQLTVSLWLIFQLA